jgi:hypothetical protein
MIYYGDKAMRYTACSPDENPVIAFGGFVDVPEHQRNPPDHPQAGFMTGIVQPKLNPYYVSIPERFGNQCNRWVRITYGGKTAFAQVVEVFDDLDIAIMMSPALVTYFGEDPDEGNWSDVSWTYDAPPNGKAPWTVVIDK